jgi:23S rRNA (cytidine1920-2'-O)/16S rRNA (cytidine1409-2'-O)-methyltransferase
MRSLRLDVALVERDLAVSRERAKAMILSQKVCVNGAIEAKPAKKMGENDCIEVKDIHVNFVGRGYLKLEKALNAFYINVSGVRCLDVGASTGGFTQLLLAKGAALVVAVDVGSGQLAKILCEDRRVINMEKIDFRNLRQEKIGEIAFACVDVSFISLKHILPHLYAFLHENGSAVCLVKPQFELGPRRLGKRGVVRDASAQEEAVEGVLLQARQQGFRVCGLTYSPICGGEGNLEFLVYLHKNRMDIDVDPKMVVRQAWKELKQ